MRWKLSGNVFVFNLFLGGRNQSLFVCLWNDPEVKGMNGVGERERITKATGDGIQSEVERPGNFQKL